jgi:C4-type Zn-finger protein
MEENTAEEREVDGLCPECGHAFKVHVDRLLSQGGAAPAEDLKAECPVCGCGNCRIGRSSRL